MGQATVFHHVRIFDGSRMLDDDTVVIQDGIITTVGKDLLFPLDARVIEGTGCTLLPGLIDAHTHILHVCDLRQALIFGVTTTLDMGTYWRTASQIKQLLQTDGARSRRSSLCRDYDYGSRWTRDRIWGSYSYPD